MRSIGAMRSLLLPSDVDELLGLGRGRALRMARSGQLPAVFLPGGQVRFCEEEIEAFIGRHSVDAETVLAATKAAGAGEDAR